LTPQNPTLPGATHIASLDGIRAISVLIVVIAHGGFGHLVPGGFGVTVFFFLSGYLITTLLIREWDRFGGIAFKAFYLRRLLRLSPPLLATMLASAALVLIGLAEGDLSPAAIAAQLFFVFNYYALMGGLGENVAGLGVLWSLSVEEHFYMIWPALFVLLARRRFDMRTIVYMLIAVLLWRTFRFIGLDHSENSIYLATDTRFDSLLFGCLLAFAQRTELTSRLFPSSTPALAFWTAAGLGALLFTLLFRDDVFRSTLRYSIQGAAMIPLFHYAVSQPDRAIFKPLNWSWVARVGTWSYTIYLGHFVIIKVLQAQPLVPDNPAVITAIGFALSALWAHVVYEYLEKPLRPLRKRLTGHVSPPAQPSPGA
jgi:peptidoglycan/LPS O-acetylase OafA/YrhL